MIGIIDNNKLITFASLKVAAEYMNTTRKTLYKLKKQADIVEFRQYKIYFLAYHEKAGNRGCNFDEIQKKRLEKEQEWQ